jgi:hypothetical protein
VQQILWVTGLVHGGAGALRTLKRARERAFHLAATSNDPPNPQICRTPYRNATHKKNRRVESYEIVTGGIEGLCIGSHGERFSRRGLFRTVGTTHDELESEFVVATRTVLSPP